MGRPSARGRLLDCAEELFAQQGLDGVSLRSINADAGLSPAALHYHFGTKEALVRALLERHMPALMEERRQRFDDLESRPGTATTREILEALAAPLLALLADGGSSAHRYLRFIARLQADGDLDPSFVTRRWPRGVSRLLPMLERANPSLPRRVLDFRLHLAIDVLLRSLAHGPPARRGGHEAHSDALLDFLTGAMEAPLQGESR